MTYQHLDWCWYSSWDMGKSIDKIEQHCPYSTLLHYIYLRSGLWDIDDKHRNPNDNTEIIWMANQLQSILPKKLWHGILNWGDSVGLISKSRQLSLSRVMWRLSGLGVSKNYFGRQLKFLRGFISLSRQSRKGKVLLILGEHPPPVLHQGGCFYFHFQPTPPSKICLKDK